MELFLFSTDIKNLLIQTSNLFQDKEDLLCKLDSLIGDGDHGISMARGFRDIKTKANNFNKETPSEMFKISGDTLISSIGGAIGPFFGTIFRQLARASKGKGKIGLTEITNGFELALIKIQDLGGAKVGDKTMVDAIYPTVISLKESLLKNYDLKTAMNLALKAADKGVKSTIPLIANKGRSKFLRERAIGHQDAGATSFYYLIYALDLHITKKMED